MLCNIYSANDLNCKACMVVVVKVKILSLLEKVLTVMYFCFMLWLVQWLTLSNLFNAIYSSPWKAPAYIFNIKYISDLPLTIDTHPYLKNKEIINKHRHLKEHTHTYMHNIWHTHILTIARHSLKMQQVFRFLFSESESDSKTDSTIVKNSQKRSNSVCFYRSSDQNSTLKGSTQLALTEKLIRRGLWQTDNTSKMTDKLDCELTCGKNTQCSNP